ncbi:MAG: alpha/beta hydrolase [Alphaproteobacteria bacterium]
MKNLLVFLHGKGADQNDKQEFISHLSDFYDADVLSINGAFVHKNGFKWFDKKDGIASQEDFSHSVQYVLEIVSKVSKTYEKTIFVGHSQGGIVAIATALKMSAEIAISVCGDLPQGLVIPKNNDKTIIYWIEGGKDEFLSQERRNTYKFFKQNSYQIKYILSKETSHNGLDLNIINELA